MLNRTPGPRTTLALTLIHPSPSSTDHPFASTVRFETFWTVMNSMGVDGATRTRTRRLGDPDGPAMTIGVLEISNRRRTKEHTGQVHRGIARQNPLSVDTPAVTVSLR
jgi:hypothetical protein